MGIMMTASTKWDHEHQGPADVSIGGLAFAATFGLTADVSLISSLQIEFFIHRVTISCHERDIGRQFIVVTR